MDCSELPVSSNGAWVLNTRNGMCNGNTGKMMQMHDWNFKQCTSQFSLKVYSPMHISLSFPVSVNLQCIGQNFSLRSNF